MPIRISGSTGISGLDGSATTPVLQGASANSGIYYSGNTVFVSTSGTNALTIGPSGNVAFANSSVSIGGQTISAYSGMMKNRIINGDFRIDQRFAGSGNNNIATWQYVVDRWVNVASSSAKLRFQQNNTNGPGSSSTQNATGFPNYFGANVVSSNTINTNDYWVMAQYIEGLNISDLGWGTANAVPVTLSFWSYTSVPGTHTGSVRNANLDRTYPFTYSISTANTWQYQTITIPGETTGSWWSNNSTGMSIVFDLGSGSSYRGSGGSWANINYHGATGSVQVVNNANGSFYLTGVQLEKGSQATPYEFRHYTTELQLCQRYFNKTNPENGTGLGGGGAAGSLFSSTSATMYYAFPVRMRVAPTFFRGGAQDNFWRSGGSGTDTATTGLTTSSVNNLAFEVSSLTNPGAAGYPIIYNGQLSISSELVVQN